MMFSSFVCDSNVPILASALIRSFIHAGGETNEEICECKPPWSVLWTFPTLYAASVVKREMKGV